MDKNSFLAITKIRNFVTFHRSYFDSCHVSVYVNNVPGLRQLSLIINVKTFKPCPKTARIMDKNRFLAITEIRSTLTFYRSYFDSSHATVYVNSVLGLRANCHKYQNYQTSFKNYKNHG